MASEQRRAVTVSVTGSSRVRAFAVDAGLVLAVPAALLWVFTLSPSAREALVLSYTSPTLTAMYASHFVHQTPAHLFANLLGYAFVVPVTYLLCVASGRRQLFRVVFVALLVALPFALSSLNLLFVRPRVGYGFSGIVMGYFGFLPLALIGFLDATLDVDVEADLAPALFFVGIVIISGAVVAVTAVGFGIGVAGLLICVAYARGLGDRSARRMAVELWRAPAGYAELAAIAFVLFVSYPFVAFPANVLGAGTIVNLYTHLLGYAIGFISTYALLLGGSEFDH